MINKKWNEYVRKTRREQLLNRASPYLKKGLEVEFYKFVDAELKNKSNMADKVVMALRLLGNGENYKAYGLPQSLVIAKKFWNGEVKEYER